MNKNCLSFKNHLPSFVIIAFCLGCAGGSSSGPHESAPPPPPTLAAAVATPALPPVSCSQEQIEKAAATFQSKHFSGQKIRAASDLVMDTFYQNSRASKLPPYEVLKLGEMKGYDRKRNEISKGSNSFIVDLKEAQKSQYYIQCPTGSVKTAMNERSCNSLCEVPPSYIWGGMGWYAVTDPAKGIELDLFRNFDHTNVISKHPGMDCSGLVYSIFATAGLRVNKDLNKTHTAEVADNTPARSYLVTDTPESCFTEIQPLKKDIQPGDLITWKTHILLVDEVGKDPFGIEHIRKAEDCGFRNIKPDKATLIAMNSKGGFDFANDQVEQDYLVNSYYAAGIYQHMLMHNRFVDQQKSKNPEFTGTKIDEQRFLRVKSRLTGEVVAEIEKRVEAGDLMLTAVGVGTSKMKFGEMMISGPQPLFDLAIRACRAKFNSAGPSKSQEPAFVPAKVVRHLAAAGKAPCECISRNSELIHLRTKLDSKTASEYCKQ